MRHRRPGTARAVIALGLVAGTAGATSEADEPASVCDPADVGTRDRMRGVGREKVQRKGNRTELFE